MRSSTFVCMVTAVIIAMSVLASNRVMAQERGLPSSLEQSIERLRTDLQARGYEVAQGSWKLFTIQDCKFAIASLGNCLGNNPTAPYVFPSVPLWRDEYVDRDMKDVFGPLPHDTRQRFVSTSERRLSSSRCFPRSGSTSDCKLTSTLAKEGSTLRIRCTEA
jgi:hypothetical protein